MPTIPLLRRLREALAPADATAAVGRGGSTPTAVSYELFNQTPPVQRFVESGPGYAVMEDPYGNRFRAEGSRPWRNNNPGNIRNDSPFAARHGGVGEDKEGFAVFPSPETGLQALKTLLFQPDSRYRNKTVNQTVMDLAPPQDNNDTARYQAFVQKLVGTNAPISRLSPDQREAMVNAILRMEGFPKGGTVQMDNRAWQAKPPMRTR